MLRVLRLSFVISRLYFRQFSLSALSVNDFLRNGAWSWNQLGFSVIIVATVLPEHGLRGLELGSGHPALSRILRQVKVDTVVVTFAQSTPSGAM